MSYYTGNLTKDKHTLVQIDNEVVMLERTTLIKKKLTKLSKDLYAFPEVVLRSK